MKLLSDYVTAASGIKSFGEGPRAYSNVSEENKNQFPRVWLHQDDVNDNPSESLRLEPIHTFVFDLSTFCDFDATTETMAQIFEELEPIYAKYMQAVIKDSRINHDYKLSIRRKKLYHDLDANLIGWMVFLTVQLRQSIKPEC